MRIGLATGGGDCPGLNAAYRAVVRAASRAEDEIIGFHHGWRGVVEGDAHPLTTQETKGSCSWEELYFTPRVTIPTNMRTGLARY